MTTASALAELSLGGSAEIAALLDVSRQRVTQLAATPGFPTPIAHLAMGNVYNLNAVMYWAVKNRRDLDEQWSMTFGQYLDESIDVAGQDAQDIDLDAMREDFCNLIEPYGVALTDPIPPTFYPILTHSFG